MNVPEALFGKPGEPVPVVDPNDLKAVWKMRKEIERTHPGQHIAIALGVVEHTCKPGADAKAVSYRASLLAMIMTYGRDELADCLEGTEPTDAIFRAAAITKMEFMPVGVERQGPPMDVDQFMRIAHGQA